VLDTALNPVLILGLFGLPRMGIAGSATATAIANYASLAALLVHAYRRDLPLRLRGAELAYLRPQPALLRTILGKGLPMGLQMMVVSGAALAMMGLVNRHGVDTAAAYGVASQLWTYIQMPAMAIGAAVSAMAAQNIGANRWDRVIAATRAGVAFNVLLTGVLVVVVTLADRHVLGLFLPADSPAVPLAQRINAIVGWGFVLFGVTIVLFGTIRARGAVIAPLVILAISMFPVRLGLARLLEPALGVDALWWSFPIASAASMTMALLYWRFGRWRQARMGAPAVADPRECEQVARAPAEHPGAGSAHVHP
jgi:Na+-driven multidrug efflux pump